MVTGRSEKAGDVVTGCLYQCKHAGTYRGAKTGDYRSDKTGCQCHCRIKKKTDGLFYVVSFSSAHNHDEKTKLPEENVTDDLIFLGLKEIAMLIKSMSAVNIMAALHRFRTIARGHTQRKRP